MAKGYMYLSAIMNVCSRIIVDCGLYKPSVQAAKREPISFLEKQNDHFNKLSKGYINALWVLYTL